MLSASPCARHFVAAIPASFTTHGSEHLCFHEGQSWSGRFGVGREAKTLATSPAKGLHGKSLCESIGDGNGDYGGGDRGGGRSGHGCGEACRVGGDETDTGKPWGKSLSIFASDFLHCLLDQHLHLKRAVRRGSRLAHQTSS